MKVLGSTEWRAWWREWWCGGQNKNGTIVGLWMHLISEGSLMKLSAGFRLLDTPCCLATTTLQTLRAVCKIQHIYTPAEYMDGVRKARRHNQFEVHEMTSKTAVHFPSALQWERQNVDGEKITFRNVTQMRFHASQSNMMQSETYLQ